MAEIRKAHFTTVRALSRHCLSRHRHQTWPRGLLENGVSAFIRNDDYIILSRLILAPKSAPGFMVRACISHAVDVVGHIPQGFEPSLHIVLEDGHNNAEDEMPSGAICGCKIVLGLAVPCLD
jgi:hypothetical protein